MYLFLLFYVHKPLTINIGVFKRNQVVAFRQTGGHWTNPVLPIIFFYAHPLPIYVKSGMIDISTLINVFRKYGIPRYNFSVLYDNCVCYAFPVRCII